MLAYNFKRCLYVRIIAHIGCSFVMKNILLASLLFLSVMSASFVDADAQKSLPEDPLAMFIGDWQVTEGMMGREGTGSGIAHAKWSPNQNSVIIEYKSTIGPMAGFTLLEIISREKDDRHFSLAWVDSFNKGLGLKSGVLVDNNEFEFKNTSLGQVTPLTAITTITADADGFTISTFKLISEGERRLSMKLEFTSAGDQ